MAESAVRRKIDELEAKAGKEVAKVVKPKRRPTPASKADKPL
jgi:hypothetical protein